jgi:hypothetical protein
MVVNSDNTIELYATDINLSKDARIEAAKIMMFAQNDILAEEGVRIESLMDHECTTSR